ncbi:MAG: DUF389 domain-containing protein [Bacteroidales bacterium]|nr:DUF389 domain-containing protein [Bacteroidales bacterium]
MGLIEHTVRQIRTIVDLNGHMDTESAEKAIRSNIYFRGPNAWILAVAIIIASVGLNVNSIPVIIGAMLISPLMGPIFGIGLALGTNDVSLLKAAAKNLLIMVCISLVVSLVYFLITPLSLTNPTELLARTNPTIFDVIIALFGGFAGIFEQCRKEKGTVFSGVAIATALMPPLCTAGYGLASGNLPHFLGAIYLFVINCLFITLATYILVKYLGFHQTEFQNEKLKRRTKSFISLLIIIFIIPSVWSAVMLVKHNNFEEKATEFVESHKSIGKSFIYDYTFSHSNGSKIEIFMTGEPLGETDRNNLYEAAKEYGLEANNIIINEHTTERQGSDTEVIKSLYDKMDAEIAKRDERIRLLEEELRKVKGDEIPYVQIAKEIISTNPSISDIRITSGASVPSGSTSAEQCVLVVADSREELPEEQRIRLTQWLKIRLNTENLMLMVRMKPEEKAEQPAE